MNSYIFIVSTFIAAHSQLNVICGWIWQQLVEPWRSGGRGSTTSSIPQRGRIKLRSWKSNKCLFQCRRSNHFQQLMEVVFVHYSDTDKWKVDLLLQFDPVQQQMSKCAVLQVYHE